MKIAVLIDAWFPHVGGGQVHAYELAKNLAQKYNADIEVITRSHPGKTHEKKAPFKVVKLGPELPFENLFGRIFYLIASFFYVLPRRYDLIHAHAFSPGITAKLLSVIKSIPVVMTIHGTSVKGFKNEKLSLKEKVFFQIEKWLLFKIKYNAEISVSRDVLKIKNVNKNIFVIPTGADIKRFENKKVPKDKNFKIIFVGRLQRQKGLKYLIDAIPAVLLKYPKTKFLIVGLGTERKSLIDYSHQVLKKKIKNLEFKTLSDRELIHEFLSSHLFVLPSLYEGLPIVLFEAWGAKLPVIATKVGGIPDFVINGENGYLVKPKDSKELASAIIKAIENKKLNLLGEEGYKIAKNQTWEKMSEKVYKIFQKVINGKS